MIEFLKKIFNVNHNENISIDFHELSVQTNKQEISSGIRDKYGFVYSKDGLRLLKGHSFINKAKIKKSVLVICDNAFEYCFVENIQFPKNLKRIGTKSFSNARCKGNFVLPDSLEEIDSEAFAYFIDESCNIDVNFIPDSIRILGTGVFINSKINRPIIFNSYIHNVPKDTFRNGSFSKVKISDTTKHIEEYAFGNAKISSVFHLPEDIEVIDDYAFEDSSSIEELKLKNIKHIGYKCFCNNKRLTRISLSKEIESIAKEVFCNCKCIKTLDLGINSLKNIPEAMFEGCIRLESVNFPKSLVFVGARAFKNTNLQKLDLSNCNQLNAIRDESFARSNVKEVYLPENIQEIGNAAFSYCVHLKLFSFSNSLLKFGEECFYYCNELEQITGEINISQIPNSMFYCCKKLNSVKLGNNVNVIGTAAFHGCESLVSIYLPESLKEIGDLAFVSCKQMKLKLPNGIEKIGSQAFAWDWQLKTIVIPSSVRTIKGNPFCGIETKIINKSQHFVLKDNVLFSKDMSRLIYFGKVCDEYSVPEPVRIIGNNSFSYNWNIKRIILPQKVRRIESLAFYECSSLSYINLKDNIEIDDDAFENCSALKNCRVKTKTSVDYWDVIDLYYDSMTDNDFF